MNIKHYRLSHLSACIMLAYSLSSTAIIAAESDAQLERITVTAQKRVQNLQEVPLSVSAITGDNIENLSITNLEDAFQHTPGVTFTKTPITNVISVRGVSSGINDGFEQSVGTYIDGIAMGRSHQSHAPFFDIERMELLRGPQGTLFGKNTIAGAINITTRSPEIGDEFNGSVIVNYEPDSNGWSAHNETIALSVPLGDKAAMRVAMYNASNDGYVENNFTGGDEGEGSNKAYRLTFVAKPTDQLSFNLKHTSIDHEALGNPTSALNFTLIDPNSALGGAQMLFTNFADPTMPIGEFNRTSIDKNPNLSPLGFEEGLKNKANYSVLTTEYAFENGYNLTFVTSYSEYENKQSRDSDYLPIRFNSSDRREDYDQFGQEIRFTSPQDQKLSYTVGAYYDKQNLSVNLSQAFDTSYGGYTNAIGYSSLFEPLIDGAFGAGTYAFAAPFVDLFSDSDFTQESSSYAVFAEINYQLSTDVTLVLSGRYTSETKEAKQNVALTSDADGTHPFTSTIVGGVFAQFGLGAWNADNVKDPQTGALLDLSEVENSSFDPSAKIIWNYSEDAMIYLSYSEGFKSGGYNPHPSAVGPTNPATGNPYYEDFTFEPEKAKSTELGLKSTWLDNTLRVNAALYSTDYSDLQVSVFNGVVFVVDNAAESKVQGFELETQYVVNNDLTLGASVAFIDYKFENYTDGPCQVQKQVAVGLGCTENMNGKEAAFAPKWSGNLFADYAKDIAEDYLFTITSDVNFQSSSYSDFDLDPNTEQAGYAKVNMRIGFGAADQSWNVYLYGKNLTNVERYALVFDTPNVPGSYTGVVTPGRILGLGFKTNF